MTAQFSDPWEDIELSPKDAKDIYNSKPEKDAWDELELDESWGKSILRSLNQIPLGISSAVTYPLEIIKAMGVGEVLDPLEIDRLREISEREGIPFDEDKYYEAVQAAERYFPSQSSAERLIEEKTGFPLEPKTQTQKGIRFASQVGKFIPKQGVTAAGKEFTRTIPTRAGIGASAALARNTLTAKGVNDTSADLLATLMLVPVNPAAATSAGLQPLRESVNPSLRRTPASKQIEKNLLGEELPASMFETAETALGRLQEEESLAKAQFEKDLIERQAKHKVSQKLAEEEAMKQWQTQYKTEKEAAKNEMQMLSDQLRIRQNAMRLSEEEALALAESKSKAVQEPRVPFPEQQQSKYKSLKDRKILPTDKELGLVIERPTGQKKTLQNEIGDLFSKERIYNTTNAGKAINEEISLIDRDVYKGVGDLYDTAEALNAEINEIQPNLVNFIQEDIAQIEKIPDLSGPEKQLIQSMRNIEKKLVALDEEGNISGYLPINNKILLDQVKSLRKKIDYDFAHGDSLNIFKPLIQKIENEALKTANAVNPEAAQAIVDAKSGYKAWVEHFDNPYIRPIRDLSNKDFSKNFKGALDFDEFNQLKPVLDLTDPGKKLTQSIQREIVNKKLSPFFDNPRAYTTESFKEALRELEAVITPEQAKQITDSYIENLPKKLEFKAKEVIKPTREKVKPFTKLNLKPELPKIREVKPPPKPFTRIKVTSPSEKFAAKYLDKKPENIQKMLESRSGIKQLKKDLSKDSQGEKLFDTLRKQEIRRRLYDSNLEKSLTGNDLEKFFNKQDNIEILSEFLGEEEVLAMRETAKEIGKGQMRGDGIKKLAKQATAVKALHFILGLL